MLPGFREVWAVDFEFTVPPGERPTPICMVARELKSGRTIRLWLDEFGPEPLLPIGPDVLFVAYLASAELNCFRVLGWPMPARVLDLFVEFRNLTCGYRRPGGSGLLNALAYFGIVGIDAEEKTYWRDIAIRGGPFTAEERAGLLDYCETDVLALERLLPVMAAHIDLPRALLRGRYMCAVSAMEHAGVPIDVETLGLLQTHWTNIQDDLIAEIDADYQVFDGRTFKADRWEGWLARKGIPWPRLESGRLDLSDDTFREMAKTYPAVSPMRELRSALSSLRLSSLEVGADGRNRTMLGAFGSRTSRNQPSNAKYIFGPSVWLRGLIKPTPDHGLAYIDFSAQEFGIAAALSRDEAMIEAYLSGDPYLTFGKQCGALPSDATKKSHEAERQLFKACILGLQYGMGELTLSHRIDKPSIVARHLILAHRETYRRFWKWSDNGIDQALLTNVTQTVFGWRMHVHAGNCNPRFLRNFLMQANGAEMLRLSCCLATERGIEVVAPVHDAIMICAPLDRLDEDVARTQSAMAEASRIVLAGFEIRTDANVVRYPDRYMDPRGTVMWERVLGLIAKQQKRKAA